MVEVDCGQTKKNQNRSTWKDWVWSSGSLLDRFKHVSASRRHTEDRWTARGMGATFRLEAPGTGQVQRCRGEGVRASRAVLGWVVRARKVARQCTGSDEVKRKYACGDQMGPQNWHALGYIWSAPQRPRVLCKAPRLPGSLSRTQPWSQACRAPPATGRDAAGGPMRRRAGWRAGQP